MDVFPRSVQCGFAAGAVLFDRRKSFALSSNCDSHGASRILHRNIFPSTFLYQFRNPKPCVENSYEAPTWAHNKEKECILHVNSVQKNYAKMTFEPKSTTRLIKHHKSQTVQGSTLICQHLGSHLFFSLAETKNSHEVLSKFTLLIGMIGLAICPEAWAGTETVAKQSLNLFGDLGDVKNGFASAFLLIFFSEIGDRTFFIAALLASRKSNTAVFTGTFGALAAMTVISVFLGRTFHYIDGILPFSFGEIELPLDDLAAVVLLVYFGVTTLVEATTMKGSKAEEEQQEAELAIAGVGSEGAGLQAAANIALATFALVFVAEWGDKSFFSTIALAAASSPLGVVLGAIAGHGAATLLAVLGGSFLSTYISEKAIAYTGGILFLVFAAITLVEISGKEMLHDYL